MEEKKISTESDKELELLRQKEAAINQKIIDSRKGNVFRNVNILTSRPKDMSFEEYKEIRNIQKVAIKNYLSTTR